MKKLFIFIFISTLIFASQNLKNQLSTSIFEINLPKIFKTLAQEVGQARFQEEYNGIVQEENFQNVLKNLAIQRMSQHRRKTNQDALLMPNFDQALQDLNKSIAIKDSFIKSYLGLEIIKIRYWMNDVQINKSYTLPFAESAYAHKLCYGYFYYGLMTNKVTRDIGKAVKIWGEGVKECKDPIVHKNIKLRYYKYDYMVKNNIPLTIPKK